RARGIVARRGLGASDRNRKRAAAPAGGSTGRAGEPSGAERGSGRVGGGNLRTRHRRADHEVTEKAGTGPEAAAVFADGKGGGVSAGGGLRGIRETKDKLLRTLP